MTLAEFHAGLKSILDLQDLRSRPFDSDGSPLKCNIFIVGSNPRMTLDKPFLNYWSNDTGFKKKDFIDDYIAQNGKLQPTRCQIEKIITQLARSRPRGATTDRSGHIRPTILVTNLYPYTSTDEKNLEKGFRKDDVLRYLLRTIKPDAVVAHGSKAMRFFKKECERIIDLGENIQEVTWGCRQIGLVHSHHLRAPTDVDWICDALTMLLRRKAAVHDD
ncbi:MAG: hypothetical protein WDO17_21510 [Alphaproteobacteria bacterium]